MYSYKALVMLLAASIAHAHPNNTRCLSSSVARPSPTALIPSDAYKSYSDLMSAPTAIERFKRLLVDDGKLRTGNALKDVVVFDFNGAQPADGATGGAFKAATAETYPFSTGLDISMTVVFLEPCGINTPHVHPRATEFLLLAEGSNVRFGSVLENGLVEAGQNQEITGVLNKLEATLFPQGSIHYQFNDGCERAIMIAALNSNNPGTSQMAQNIFSLNPGVINATLGGLGEFNRTSLQEFRDNIPANLAQDLDGCLTRCRL